MKINVLAIGKIKDKYFFDAVKEYLQRASRFADVVVTELAEAPFTKSPEEQRRIESALLLSKAKGCIVAMDARGTSLSSEELAAFIDKKGVGGTSEISFLIGGSNGLAPEVLARAEPTISFGRATFPHQLFRVMLCEQIYRALTINAGLPYHK